MAIGCYTEPYLPASFRGVPFVATEATSKHGRRGAEGEFPFGETTAYADLGRRIRTYTLRGRFQTNLHTLEAAAFIAACERTGPGVLVHPTRGVILSAACKSLTITDKPEDEAGVTYVDVEFVEGNSWPNGLSLVGQLISAGIGLIVGASRTHFNASYAPSTVQPYRKAAVIDSVQEQVSNIRTQYAAVTTDQADNESRSRILADLERFVVNDAMAEDPETADRALALGMSAIAANVTGLEKFRVFRLIANGAAKTSTFTAPAATVENAVYSSVRSIAASYMAEGALEAQNVRTGIVYDQIDILAALLEGEIAYARGICDNHYQTEMTNFLTDVTAELYAKAYDAPGLVEYDFGGRVHPLNAAYAIYGDAKRHRDLEPLNIQGPIGRIGPVVTGPLGA